MKNSKILVPTDFTAAADCALDHAAHLAMTFNSEIVLLHVVAKEKEVADAQFKVDAMIKKLAKKGDGSTPMSAMVRVGNIFDDIGAAAAAAEATLIIMGTHGVKGIQNITGSYALKVITNSKIPFIIVQNKTVKQTYGRIVLPLNLSKETKQKVELATEMAKNFNSKMHIITPKETDDFLLKTLNHNLAFAIRHFKSNNIEYMTHTAEGKKDFADEVIKFAISVDADMISIVNFEGGGGMNLFGSGYEQKIISNNAHIPVMCVNPPKARYGMST